MAVVQTFQATFINCKCNYRDDEKIKPDKQLEVVADEGYVFEKDINYTIDIGLSEFNVPLLKTPNLKMLYFDTSEFTGWASPDIYMEKTYEAVEGVAPPPTPVPISITGTFVNCACNYSDGDSVDLEKSVVITATKGYSFEPGVYQLEVNDLVVDFIRSDDGSTLTYGKEFLEITSKVVIPGVYTANKDIVEITPFIKLYTPSNDELVAINNYRYTHGNLESDLFNNITKLYICPFPVPSELEGPRRVVKLGKTETDTECVTVQNYEFTFDLGTIEVPEVYKGVEDYTNTEIRLLLPYADPVTLDVTDVIGSLLRVTLLYNYYTGTGVYNVKSDNIVIHTRKVDIHTSYPYILKKDIDDSMSTILDNEVTTPTVIVRRPIPLYKDDRESTYVTGRVGDMKGYIEVSQLKLEGFQGTLEEYNTIINIMKEGVVIE